MSGEGESKGKEEGRRKDGGKVHPPDKKKFEKELHELNREIKEKEARLKPVTWSPSQSIAAELSKISGELAEVEEKRAHNTAEVRRIEDSLRKLGADIIHKRDEASKLIAGVRHKSEVRINESISKLEQQLQTKQFSPSEERRLQSEIDSLQRSKERLKDYLATKVEVDKMRNEQDQLRKRRDTLYRLNRDHREKESEVKDHQAELRKKLDEKRERHKEAVAEKGALSKEIDVLYKQRQELREDFRRQQQEWLEVTRETREAERAQREEEARRREKERRARGEARRRRQAAEMEMLRDLQYEEEKAVCKALIAHLTQLSLSVPHSTEPFFPPSPSLNTPGASASMPPVLLNATMEVPGKFLRRKTGEEDQVLLPAAPSHRRRSKRDRKRNTPTNKVPKRLNYNAAIFSQFSFLSLSPPTTHAEISSSLVQLKEKLSFYESESGSKNTDSEAGDSGVGSMGCSEPLDISEHELTSQEDLMLDPVGLSPKQTSVDEKPFCIEGSGNSDLRPSSSDSSVAIGISNGE